MERWFQYIITTGMEQCAAALEARERMDAYCNQIPRFKMCDDKSGILLTIERI
ncbi:hypothetical protein ABEW50_26575 [Paenibacillus jamilae]